MMTFPLRGTVEIDEAVVTGRRKYNRGRLMRRIFWAFGLYSREDRRGYVFVVPDRTTQTIFPIIEK